MHPTMLDLDSLPSLSSELRRVLGQAEDLETYVCRPCAEAKATASSEQIVVLDGEEQLAQQSSAHELEPPPLEPPPPTRADGERAEGGVPEASEVGDGIPLFGPEARRLQARLA